MLTTALLIQLWRLAVVQPPVFRPSDPAPSGHYEAKIKQGRDLERLRSRP
jgi:hypothetical protein